jgi:hypothetical protein
MYLYGSAALLQRYPVPMHTGTNCETAISVSATGYVVS